MLPVHNGMKQVDSPYAAGRWQCLSPPLATSTRSNPHVCLLSLRSLRTRPTILISQPYNPIYTLSHSLSSSRNYACSRAEMSETGMRRPSGSAANCRSRM